MRKVRNTDLSPFSLRHLLVVQEEVLREGEYRSVEMGERSRLEIQVSGLSSYTRWGKL